MEESKVASTEQITRRSYARGTLELLGGIGLIAAGVILNDSATPYLIAGGVVSATLGYADIAHPVG